MNRSLLTNLLILGMLSPVLANANVTKEDFEVKTTRNLINLCTASPQDPHYGKAIHFCHGYLVGAFHYHTAQASDDSEKLLACFPEPKPSRNEAIDRFVAWALEHSEFMNEVPVETEFRFLIEKWPCKR